MNMRGGIAVGRRLQEVREALHHAADAWIAPHVPVAEGAHVVAEVSTLPRPRWVEVEALNLAVAPTAKTSDAFVGEEERGVEDAVVDETNETARLAGHLLLGFGPSDSLVFH
jgi:hypothetical protein